MADTPAQQPEAPSTPAPTPAVSPAPVPAQPATGAVEQDEKFFAALGYFGPLFVIPLIVKPKSAYCKFHARQSMVLFLVTIIVLVVLASVPWFGSLLTLALFAVYVLAIYKSYMGDLWSIPFVSTWAGKVNVEAMYGKAGLAVGTLSGIKDKAASMAEKAGEQAKALGKQEEDKPAAAPPEEPATPPAPPSPSPPSGGQELPKVQ